MILFKIIFAILVCYNLASVISESSFPVFRWLRTRDSWVSELTSCFFCSSIWTGILASVVIFDTGTLLDIELIPWFWSGIFYSSIAWFIHIIEQKIG